ncbi:hypothetical protein [Nonomuraea cavernae]|uniref:Uncharacterized protein n=1 Tax=Nonomuraea cavernae TaxID=2045107 RepID=A0A917ZGX8_9ACTN|nr:hypothetical protein [Nonomuraea cavernae]MCA2190902.1 hypothetical protein [Nonomuraea cavernae]GGO83150.1 hypothetical protein GCM10012289_76020 [Nonomuraea cavernae]
MTKTTLAAAALAAAAVLVAPTAASAGTPATAGASAARPLQLRNGLTLNLPPGWKVYGRGDWIQVVTGACANPRGGYGHSECDSFSILGPDAIKIGNEVFKPYTAKRPFYPATDVQACPHNHRWGQVLGGAAAKGLRQVGPGHKAHYREWKAKCVSYSNGTVKSRYVQREWYLPQSRILIVDRWNTPGLPGVLKRAVWR